MFVFLCFGAVVKKGAWRQRRTTMPLTHMAN